MYCLALAGEATVMLSSRKQVVDRIVMMMRCVDRLRYPLKHMMETCNSTTPARSQIQLIVVLYSPLLQEKQLQCPASSE